MPIYIDEEKKIFKLDTENSSYVFSVYDGGYLLHNYYGSYVSDIDLRYLIPKMYYSSFSADVPEQNGISLDTAMSEYPCEGSGDMRITAVSLKGTGGHRTTSLKYKGYALQRGKPTIPGLPATYAGEDEADTLSVFLEDEKTGAEVTLFYTVFKDFDVITRNVCVKNISEESFSIQKIYSMSLDIPSSETMELMHLFGSWGRERTPERQRLSHNTVSLSSRRGASGHAENPFAALCEKNADENFGSVYGFSLVYSGNFSIDVSLAFDNTARIMCGIGTEGFSWLLNPGESFYSPETVMTYSKEGLSKMSRTFNKLYREHLCRGVWRDRARPIIINNWEATYFDFNEEKLLSIAKAAAKLSVELFVLDDGWFGKRDDDTSSLGDWYPDKNKLPGGIRGISEKIEALGMKFGLWFEPEMISENSELYREHPDYAVHIDGRPLSPGRHQYVLDLTKDGVTDYIFSRISEILDNAKVSYIKWDFNRNITEAAGGDLPPERQGEFFHRYVLALYALLERIHKKYPDLLLEGCSGGGGRFDPGFLYYAPQFWTSDDTDAIERMDIQYGTSFVYPMSSISAHVSVCPNHQTGRTLPFKTRCDTALTGAFGYELDITKLSDEEKELVKLQNENYRRYSDLLTKGDYYRLKSPYEDRESCAWCFVSEDKAQALLTFAVIRAKPGTRRYIKLCGLLPKERYRLSTGEILFGDTLMNAGLDLTDAAENQDGSTTVIYLTKE